MTLSTTVKCAYCGHCRDYSVTESAGKELVSCDFDSGGCDQYAVYWKTNVLTTIRVVATDEEEVSDGEP
jgi:hypothetical protein